ncbi:MAG TPA: hypothetical protein VMS22_08570 [Candidatus Eisenbacteria bacterium]|nr:hypothetical protein [Candidatus Eisenbacteria bacterium]
MAVRSRTGTLVFAVALLAVCGGAQARDEAKAYCKQGCEDALQSCKSDCRNERDSGTDQETSRYAGCDASCHNAYASCKSDCENAQP